MSKALYIFDFDGTIADTAQVVLELGNQVFAEHNMPAVTAADFERLKSYGPKELLKELHVPVWVIPKLVTSIKRELQKRIDSIDPIQGMPELLKELKADPDSEIAILSSNSPENIDFFLEKYDLDGLFEHIETNVGVFAKKNRLKKLLKIIRPDSQTSVVYIGDEARDVEAALKAGITPAAVAWGLNSADLLKRSGATLVSEDVAQLKQILRELKG